MVLVGWLWPAALCLGVGIRRGDGMESASESECAENECRAGLGRRSPGNVGVQ